MTPDLLQLLQIAVTAAGFGGIFAQIRMTATNNTKAIDATNKKVDDLSAEVTRRMDRIEDDQAAGWASHNKLKERVAGAEGRCSVTHARGTA